MRLVARSAFEAFLSCNVLAAKNGVYGINPSQRTAAGWPGEPLLSACGRPRTAAADGLALPSFLSNPAARCNVISAQSTRCRHGADAASLRGSGNAVGQADAQRGQRNKNHRRAANENANEAAGWQDVTSDPLRLSGVNACRCVFWQRGPSTKCGVGAAKPHSHRPSRVMTPWWISRCCSKTNATQHKAARGWL
jgi:hypothetical protein